MKDLKKIFSQLDNHMHEVMYGAALAFSLKVIGASLSFTYNVILARILGADGIGIYFIALSISVIASVFSRVGLDNTLLRFVATHATLEEWGKVNGVYILGMRILIIISGITTLVMYLLAPLIATAFFNEPKLADPLRWMCLSILPFALLNAQAECLKGLKRIRSAMIVQGIGLPFISLLLLYPLSQTAGISGAVWAYLIGTILMAILGFWSWRKAIPTYQKSLPSSFPLSTLIASCRPLFVVSVMNRAILPWAPLFLLGIWETSDTVGVFGVALRVMLLVSFILTAANNVLAPKFAELYAKNNIEVLEKTVRHSALLMTLLTSPFLIFLIFKGNWVMSIFGSEFEKGAYVISILSVGQFINVLCGSVGHLLIMSGNEDSVKKANMLAAFFQVALCLILIPFFGILGAALAGSIGIIFLNLRMTWIVWKKLNIISIPSTNKYQ